MNFVNRAFLVGVEDEGSVDALVEIDIGEGQAGSFALFGQMTEGLLDVGGGVADVQPLWPLNVVGDGRGRMLLPLSRATFCCHCNG